MISEKAFVEALGLTVLAPSETGTLDIKTSDINRPGLPLAGYWHYFSYMRPQVIGKVEMSYMDALPRDILAERLEKFFRFPIPCVIVCHGMACTEEMARAAARHGVPVYASERETTDLVYYLVNFLNNELAARTTVHGVLVDVFGSGVLITGKSGVGKSEAALELIKRGHRLVADDVVDICRVSDTLVGEAPEMVRHFMEIRGIGVIDVSTLYGIGAVIPSKTIDMEIRLEIWRDDVEYDRLGLTDTYSEILGVRVPRLVIPIRPGRNIAIVLEVAARYQRLKDNGYNAGRELDNRLRERLARGADDT